MTDSHTAAEKLKKYQLNLGTNVQKLIHDVPTRWNFTYNMIDRFIILEEPIKATIAIINKNLPQITSAEWEILHELAVILKPIESATKIISGEQYPTISIIIPLTSGLKNICQKLKQKDFSTVTQQIIYHIEIGILERFTEVETDIIIQIFSLLTKLVNNLFCMVATSVLCERLFSKAGLILTEKRNRLQAEKLSMLLFCSLYFIYSICIMFYLLIIFSNCVTLCKNLKTLTIKLKLAIHNY
ncbi:uncharacterized protein LOC128887676 [Hylaeus anthracinus]|uniref:uncharacterized protein LOC128887676 n=1 Tax=Hylaeus anthracinus TaxID=313031 RepID=UPI0023B8D786|nr:uncharacterized protein LOC128887676 [Hylaeus anthracinus]